MAGSVRRTSRNALKTLRGRSGNGRVDHSDDVPGPSPDPASNLIMADVAMRMGSYLMRRAIQRSFLKGRYGKDAAKDIVRNRSIAQTLTSVAIARLATGSLPGAALVTTGMAAKLLIDRSKARNAAEAEGDEELLEQARGQ